MAMTRCATKIKSVSSKRKNEVTPSRIFLQRYEQIRSIVGSPTDEALLNLPLALRLVLADGNPLVHQANRPHNLKLVFTVGLSVRQRTEEMSTLGIPVPDIHWLAMFPPNDKKTDIDLDKLLAFEAVKIYENYYSNYSLLDACANKLGGVHFDPKGDKDTGVRDIRKLGIFLEQHGIGSAFDTLILLARTAVAGLQPLYGAVAKV